VPKGFSFGDPVQVVQDTMERKDNKGSMPEPAMIPDAFGIVDAESGLKKAIVGDGQEEQPQIWPCHDTENQSNSACMNIDDYLYRSEHLNFVI
jgi:hypothetical protein